jgi:peptidoglycan/LPS O-acetylase OafA/YrhL
MEEITKNAGGHPPYRKDIEGLRAVAVLPVVAYHVGLSAVPGGFVGVDIFFVISGFLITQLLYSDIQAGRFSLLDFYERRIRRIGPALLAMLIVTFLLGVRYCLPDDLTLLAKSLVAATLWASNFYFCSTAGYFDLAATSKPLLHTWSLAVEEQFYIVWPVFLAIGTRYLRSRLVPVIVIIVAASLVLAIIGAYRFPTATFYLPFSRLWELAAGGLIALGLIPQITDRRTRNILAVIGTVFIIGSVFLIRPTTPYPGLFAIPPCAGAALIIVAGRGGGSVIGSLLSLRPVMFIGAISYSLYMWHWPITVFQRNYALLADGLSSGKTKLLVVVVSIAVATLSHRFIEQPFRSGRLRPSRRPLMRLAVAGMAASVTLGLTASASDGFPARFSQKELQTYEHLRLVYRADWRTDACFLWDHRTQWKLATECLAFDEQHKNYLLLGDSHAAELFSGLHAVYPDVNFLQATAADCLPTITHATGESSQCIDLLDGILRDFLVHTPVTRVTLSARWTPSSLDALAATLDWMNEHRIAVTLLGPTAVYDSPVPRLVISAMRASDPSLLLRHLDMGVADLDARMAELAAAHHITYISLLALECTNTACLADGWPEINDGEHFNSAGSTLIARRIRASHPAFGT